MKKIVFLSTFFIAIDQITKYLAETYLQNDIPLYFEWLSFSLHYNTGIAFSIPIPQWILIPFIFLFLGAITFFLRDHIKKHNTWHVIIASCIFAGACGNLIDRIIRGAVVDFIRVGWWPVFNIADSLIFIGASLLILLEFSKTKTSP